LCGKKLKSKDALGGHMSSAHWQNKVEGTSINGSCVATRMVISITYSVKRAAVHADLADERHAPYVSW